MDNDMKVYVVDLLKNYPERTRRIALLHYELEHSAHMTEGEMISAMALGHGASSGGGHPDGHISDKTLYIALNYQDRTAKLNADTKQEIVVQLVELEQEQKRLNYYISLLDARQATVLRLIYFEKLPLEEIALQVGVVLRTVRKIRDRAIDELVQMYDFTQRLN